MKLRNFATLLLLLFVASASTGQKTMKYEGDEFAYRTAKELYDKGMSVADILRMDHPEMIHSKDYRNLHSTYVNICKRNTWKHLK